MQQAAGGGLPYCKTPASLLNADARNASVEPFELRDWGWPAFFKYISTSASVADSVRAASNSDFQVIHDLDVHHLSEISMSEAAGGHRRASGVKRFLSLLKLHLASTEDTSNVRRCSPAGHDLSRMSKFIFGEQRNKFGTHKTLDDVQWCLTVPAIWDDLGHSERLPVKSFLLLCCCLLSEDKILCQAFNKFCVLAACCPYL